MDYLENFALVWWRGSLNNKEKELDNFFQVWVIVKYQ